MLAAGMLVAATVQLLFGRLDYFQQLNSLAYDFTLRLAGPIHPSSPTVIVAFDEDSLARVGRWPWSRDKIARVIDQVAKANPKVIALDMLLDDASNPDDDAALAHAIGRSQAVVLATRIDKVEGRETCFIWRTVLI